uniref:Uncharacterized protein n=1 Tax=Rhipicephalus appendiculatus TaxID=34631 RepID=A0A131YC16_RHIAP
MCGRGFLAVPVRILGSIPFFCSLTCSAVRARWNSNLTEKFLKNFWSNSVMPVLNDPDITGNGEETSGRIYSAIKKALVAD